MPIITLPRFLLSIISLAILASAIYLAYSWYDGNDVVYSDGAVRYARGDAWRLYSAIGLAGWSFLGRFVILTLMPHG